MLILRYQRHSEKQLAFTVPHITGRKLPLRRVAALLREKAKRAWIRVRAALRDPRGDQKGLRGVSTSIQSAGKRDAGASSVPSSTTDSSAKKPSVSAWVIWHRVNPENRGETAKSGFPPIVLLYSMLFYS